jgi:uncharacterized repeat protein (TIGR03803 family)
MDGGKVDALYGSLFEGGHENEGGVYALAAPETGRVWKEKFIHSFDGGRNDGKFPRWSLLLGADGALYGTAQGGGDTDFGIVFKLEPPPAGKKLGKFRVLHRFQAGNDGYGPSAGLVEGSNGVLYGTTLFGGKLANCGGGCGVIFQMTPLDAEKTRWKQKVLYIFDGSGDGGKPVGNLVVDTSDHDTLYGATLQGGSTDHGTVFRLTH